MFRDTVLVIAGLLGGLFIQQSAEIVVSSAPLWVSLPVSLGGVAGFVLIFVVVARWVIDGRSPLRREPTSEEDD